MKTAKQWAARVQNSKEPWEKLVWEIQSDALQYAAAICIHHAQTGNLSGWTDAVSRECATRINEERVTAMPNSLIEATPGPN